MTPTPHLGLPRWARWLFTLAFFGAVGALILSQLPRGAYPTDLSRVGKGRAALVLAYDINTLGGMSVMRLMDAVRGEYAGRVEFLVAPLGEPGGSGFARRFDAGSGSVMLFSASGSHLLTMHGPADADTLRGALDQALSVQVR